MESINTNKYEPPAASVVRYGQWRTVGGYTYGQNGIGVTFHLVTVTIKPKNA